MKAKFVNEKLNFTEDGSDPIKDMGVGWSAQKYIEQKLREGGVEMTYRDFMEEFDDRLANQDSLGVIEDFMRYVEMLKAEGKRSEVDKYLDAEDDLVNGLITLETKLISKLSPEKQMEIFEPVLDHYIDMMNR